MNVEELSQAVTVALAVVVLIQARTTDKAKVVGLLERYAETLNAQDGHEYGAALVAEMHAVVERSR